MTIKVKNIIRTNQLGAKKHKDIIVQHNQIPRSWSLLFLIKASVISHFEPKELERKVKCSFV